MREGSGEANRVVSDSGESCKIGKVGDRKVRMGVEIVEDNVCVAVGAEKVERGHEEIIQVSWSLSEATKKIVECFG